MSIILIIFIISIYRIVDWIQSNLYLPFIAIFSMYNNTYDETYIIYLL